VVSSLALVVALGGLLLSTSPSSGATATKTAVTSKTASNLPWCGPKKASIALADGFGDNTWRLLTRYSAVVAAAPCLSVTKYVYTNGQGNTEKAISDINSLVSLGITAVVDFPDASEAMLPVITKAYHAGVIMVPYRVFPGGTAGTNYNAYISTNFVSAGVLWATDVASALKGKGNVAFLSGPPGNSQGLEERQGILSVFKKYPNIHLVGQSPFNVTNWDPATTVQVVASLLAKYKIDAVITDFGTAIASAFPDWAKAGLKIPVIATEDGNSVACGWKADVKTDPGFKLFTVSSQTWMVEYAVRYAVALATGGRVPSTTVVPQENFENSLTNSPHAPMCIPSLPATAINSSGLTNAQQLAALKGIVPSLASLRG